MQEVHSWSKLSHCPISISAAYSKTAQDQTINKAIEHLRSAGRIKSPWISVVFSLFSFSSNYQETVEILRLYSSPASYIAVFRFFITIDNLLWEVIILKWEKSILSKQVHLQQMYINTQFLERDTQLLMKIVAPVGKTTEPLNQTIKHCTFKN